MVVVLLFVILAMQMLVCTMACAAGEEERTGEARYRVFTLRKITPQKAARYLADARIESVSHIPDTNTILVTDTQHALAMATAIINLVDSEQLYTVRAVMPVAHPQDVPAPNVVEQAVEGVAVGTFLNPPPAGTPRVLIDSHEGLLYVVAPSEKFEQVVGFLDARQTAAAQARARELAELAGAVEPEPADEVNVPDERATENDAFFGNLIESLAEAERKAQAARAQRLQELRRPSEKPTQLETAGVSEVPEEPSAAEDEEMMEAVAEEEEEPSIVKRSYEVTGIELPDAELEITLPDKLNIVQLLELVGQYLGLNYMYDEKDVIGKEVSLRIQRAVKASELYAIVESVLKFRGLVMTRKGNLVTVAPAEGIMKLDPTLIDPNTGEIRAGDIVVTRIFRLKNIEVDSAKNMLTEMQLGADVRGVAATGTLIVTDYTDRMSRIEDILSMVDQPGKPREFRFRQLRYTLAATLAPKVESLVEQMGDIAITVAVTTPAAQPGRRPTTRTTRTTRTRTPTPRQPTPTPGAQTEPSPTAPTVYLDADERTNRVLMIGRAEDLDVVEEFIEALDVQKQDLRAIRLYEMQHVGAEEVLEKLQELGITGQAVGTTTRRTRTADRRITAATPGQPPQTPAAAAAAATTGALSTSEPLAEEPQVVVIEATNSLLVNATAEQHVQIATIIGYVDSETLEQAIPYVIYPLENQKPEDLAEVLNKLIQETIQDAEGKVQQVVPRQEDQIVIVSDESTFSLIVYASRKNQEWIANLIKTLDRRRPQVLIDVTLVEVTRVESFDLDLQLATKMREMTPGGSMDRLEDAVLEPFLGGTRKEATSGDVSGVFRGQAFYSDKHVQALLTAMQTKDYGRVLAKPKVLVNDGQAGTIETTNTKNVQISTVTPGGPNTDPIESVSYQPYTTGITLTITPNISEGDLLLLEVELVRSDFQDIASSATGPPDTVETNINTIVTVPNDKTIILGGLVKLNQSKGAAKVPLLGDIPLVGGLFRSIGNSTDDAKLYIFVKANILRPEDTMAGLPELVDISQRNRAAFEKLEEEFQEHQDWPGIKPQPVDPLRVLDAE
jgi:type II secretory pathway component GspD/PulD (secretin)